MSNQGHGGVMLGLSQEYPRSKHEADTIEMRVIYVYNTGDIRVIYTIGSFYSWF